MEKNVSAYEAYALYFAAELLKRSVSHYEHYP